MQEIRFACFERRDCGRINMKVSRNKECSRARIWNERCPSVDAHFLEMLHQYTEMFPHEQHGAGNCC